VLPTVVQVAPVVVEMKAVAEAASILEDKRTFVSFWRLKHDRSMLSKVFPLDKMRGRCFCAFPYIGLEALEVNGHHPEEG
jgi:hypothetical protein